MRGRQSLPTPACGKQAPLILIIFIGILAFMGCIGMFLWNVVENERTKLVWLAGAALSLAGGIIGFLLTR